MKIYAMIINFIFTVNKRFLLWQYHFYNNDNNFFNARHYFIFYSNVNFILTIASRIARNRYNIIIFNLMSILSFYSASSNQKNFLHFTVIKNTLNTRNNILKIILERCLEDINNSSVFAGIIKTHKKIICSNVQYFISNV